MVRQERPSHHADSQALPAECRPAPPVRAPQTATHSVHATGPNKRVSARRTAFRARCNANATIPEYSFKAPGVQNDPEPCRTNANKREHRGHHVFDHDPDLS